MPGNATISRTIAGSQVADALTGGAIGIDYGESETGDSTPPTVTLYFRHDGTQKITNLAINLQAYSATYGGDYSANTDLTKLLAMGADGDGFQVDFRWDDGDFDTKTIFVTGTGSSFATRVTMPVTAMSRNNAGTEVDAVTPVAGEVGATGDATLGDRAHITTRVVTADDEILIGKRQFDLYYSFNYTS